MNSLEVRQLPDSFCCVATACVELRDDLVLFRDSLNTGPDVPKDQPELLVKNDATRLLCVDAGHRCLPCFAQAAEEGSAIRIESLVMLTTYAPAGVTRGEPSGGSARGCHPHGALFTADRFVTLGRLIYLL
jgi:hypothetical protein